ncbi:hypothetical protein POJ06DRAFT_247916 [Lipomyces tetrasporus]|uniref:FACT complex subunit POB3 n=1 Tax=Lipomyces tetrasporus TaxID=54092 RepID=A0AAD7QUL1_9ASCO|nr:uncharacterized protein POJ06DRAFT_247916 [Lipomyces tetrasporus]KAJ8101802.1 hypothetical protein POJ06DRAFT_247916 [Lipomyces tetrasporus]
MADMTQFENIYFNQSSRPGRLRFANSGLGWKASSKNATQLPFLLPQSEFVSAHWSRAAKGYECRVLTKDRGVIQFDGFDLDDFDRLKSTIKHHFDTVLETRPHSIKGWNWGKTEFERSELVFNVSNRPAFEVPYAQVNNSNLVGKSEVAIELSADHDVAIRGPVGVRDELVEMRFYIPGTVPKNEDDDESQSDVEEQNAASAFYETIKERADIGQVAGETIVSFSDIMFLTPRGRYDIDMYPSYLRLRGKTYDYKIQYTSIQKLFLLPKPDELHNILVIQLDPPLRQGQTRYTFLVIQFLKEEEIEVELNLEDDEFEEKYADKLKKKYDQAAHEVVGQVFRGLSGRKITVPGQFQSAHGQAGVKCSLKASEGYLYLLEKSFLFIPKPTVYMAHSDVSSVTLSRVGGSVSSSRTFDLTVTLVTGVSHQYSSINREEQNGIESYLKSKNIKIKNDLVDDQTFLAAALGSESDDSDVEVAPRGDRGSASEDEESVDEDFHADSDDSDVAEEFDEDHASSGADDESASGEEDEDDDVVDDDDESENEKPVKKRAKMD